MTITLSGNNIKKDGKKIGYYCETMGCNKWYAEFESEEGTCVKSAPTLNDLRWFVKAEFNI